MIKTFVSPYISDLAYCCSLHLSIYKEWFLQRGSLSAMTVSDLWLCRRQVSQVEKS